MARGRLISKTLGHSPAFAHLHEVAGGILGLGDFAQILFMVVYVNVDYFGRLKDDAFEIKYSMFPLSDRSECDFEQALEAMQSVGLIVRYRDRQPPYIQILNFSDATAPPPNWQAVRQEILERDGYLCQYCQGLANSVDHIIPRSLGGDEDPDNLCASCKSCNSKKGARTVEEWLGV